MKSSLFLNHLVSSSFCLGLSLCLGLGSGLGLSPVAAQSLKSASPAPLQPGINKGLIDNFVGPHYWYFNAAPGQVRVHVTFKSMGLLGNSYGCAVVFSLYDQGRTWHTDKTLSSDSKGIDYTFTGDLKKPTKVMLSITPPSGGLVRTGGDYEVEASGPITYGEQSNVDPVVHTYKQMGGYTKLLGTCKFSPDGTIQTTEGSSGTWKLFDKSTQSYVITIDGEAKQSFQYIAGRGLCDGQMIIFQELAEH